MRLIVGLGNPGREYKDTRHNVGFRVVDAFAEKFRIALDRHEMDAMTGRGRVAGGTVVVATPLTYMNLSGNSVRLLVNACLEGDLNDLLVVYDDIDLPLGRLRIRTSGSSGTHNGMRSIVASLASESFPRLRFGVRGEGYEAAVQKLRDYVLDPFEPPELERVEKAVTRAVDALVLFARGELRRAMNEFNRDPEEPEGSPATPGSGPATSDGTDQV
jgi:peptidyl-tRNA hydrolase, PTH1 family